MRTGRAMLMTLTPAPDAARPVALEDPGQALGTGQVVVQLGGVGWAVGHGVDGTGRQNASAGASVR